jgi:hypothetical protein
MCCQVKKAICLLLILLVGLGSVASAMAKPHACAAAGMVPERAAHAGHSPQQIERPLVDSQESMACADCQNDCCASGICAAGACGTGAAALHGIAALQDQDASLDFSAIDSNPSLSGHSSSPFRPPQV